MADHLNNNMLTFPRPFAFTVDDLGWNEGSDLSGHRPRGPYRCGVDGTFDLTHYKCIIDVGKALNVRVQCLFVLGEMDRENVLAEYPTTTWRREKWNNSGNVRQEQLDIMRYVSGESANMEFAFHGIGHEYWEKDGVMKRAEWYNMVDKKPWPEQIMRDHIKAYQQILSQYDLDPSHGHSFPESFVACNYGYYWNPNGKYSLGKLLTEVGVKYSCNNFSFIPELSPPAITDGGFDHGVHVIGCLNYGNQWDALNELPDAPPDCLVTDMAESHWVNWLAEDEIMQIGATQRWIEYYQKVQRLPDRYIAKNTAQLHAQWLYKKYTLIRQLSPEVLIIDNTQMPDEVYRYDMTGNLVLKFKLEKGFHISEATLDGDRIPAYVEEGEYAYVYLPPLKQKVYDFQWRYGKKMMHTMVWHDGTFNIYDMERNSDILYISLKMYGTQCLKVRCQMPTQVFSQTKGLKVNSYTYQEELRLLQIEVEALNFQGQLGRLCIVGSFHEPS